MHMSVPSPSSQWYNQAVPAPHWVIDADGLVLDLSPSVVEERQDQNKTASPAPRSHQERKERKKNSLNVCF